MGKEEVLGATKLINMLLGKPAAALLALLHIQPADPRYPIPNYLAMELILFVVCVVFFLWLKARLSADRPGGTQQVMEMVLTNPMGVGVKDLIDDIVGHGGEQHVPLMGTIALFILGANFMSLIPGLMSPTADKVVPLGCATIVFLYYNKFGIGHHGVGGYAKTLLGPVPAISPIMVIVETVSHFARLLSLTVRLWANMMVSELIYVSFLALTLGLFGYLERLNPLGYISAVVPIGIPLLLAGFHIFEAVLQAFIFTILSIIYLGVAVSEEH
jgi:F-type H+-transporting ATPase subunit a